jgi:hypothetical protein
MIYNGIFHACEELNFKYGIITCATNFSEDTAHSYTCTMYLNRGINELHMGYTNPAVYYNLYSDIITTTSIEYHPDAYTIDAKED